MKCYVSVAGGASGPGGVGTGSGGFGGTGTGGGGGGYSRRILAAIKPLSVGESLSMIDTNTALSIDHELADVVQNVTLGAERLPPLPRGEPGGIVIGRGKDIEGRLRFARVRHDLSDWWADQSSLIALTEWLNAQTRIKTDMNVEGGAMTLTDPRLSKCPLAFFTGHDPNFLRSSYFGSFNVKHGSLLRDRLSVQERTGLRKYLLDDGGFIYFDDCGVNAPAEAFVRLFLAQLRAALPEYAVDRIRNDHEIHDSYYSLGGPPVGYDIFWWGTHPPKRNFLEGVTVGDHLAVLISRRDYFCAMESVSLPTRAVHYSPSAYRISTNIVVYALTHGGISDYSKYIPEDRLTDRISIDAPTLVPALK